MLQQGAQLRREHLELHIRVVLRLANVQRTGPAREGEAHPRVQLLRTRATVEDALTVQTLQLDQIAKVSLLLTKRLVLDAISRAGSAVTPVELG